MFIVEKDNRAICNDLDFFEFMGELGIDKSDILSVLEGTIHEYIYKNPATVNELVGSQDGVVGDAFYSMCEAIENECGDIESCIEALRGPSKKGSRKADIATQLTNIVSNIRSYI